jgi:hypothetical protein
MLMELEREHPGVKASLLKSLSNVAPRHLLDRRLNPPDATLRKEIAPIDSDVAADLASRIIPLLQRPS